MFNRYKKFPQIKSNIKLSKNLSKKNDLNIMKILLNFKKNYKSLRFLVRKSGTEPILRVLVEGKDEKIVRSASNKLINSIKNLLNV